MKVQNANRFERWLGADADGGVSLREERVGRWMYAGVLGVLMLNLALDGELQISARQALAWYLGLSVTLVPLSWIVAHVVDDRRTLANWAMSVGALLGGVVILVGLGQIGIQDSSVVTSPLGLWVVSLALFGGTQGLVLPQWQAFGDHVRDCLATPVEPREPAPVATVTVAVTAPTPPTVTRRQPDYEDDPQRESVAPRPWGRG